MNLAGAIRYQLSSSFKSLSVFYSIILGIRLLGTILAISSDGEMHMAGLEINSLVFMGFLGAFTYLEDFRFLIQNGYSRTSMLKSFFIQFVVLAAVLAGLDLVFEYLCNLVFTYQSIFTQFYGNAFFLWQFIWAFLLNMAACFIVFFVTVLAQQLNKLQRMIWLVGVPIACIFTIPVIDEYLFNGVISRMIANTLNNLLGVYGDVITLWRPITTFAIITAIFLLLTYGIMRKSSLKAN